VHASRALRVGRDVEEGRGHIVPTAPEHRAGGGRHLLQRRAGRRLHAIEAREAHGQKQDERGRHAAWD
jgi:hypothetical protein